MKRVSHVCQEQNAIALIVPRPRHTTVAGLGQCVPAVTPSAWAQRERRGDVCRSQDLARPARFRGCAWAEPQAVPQPRSLAGSVPCCPSGPPALRLREGVLPTACRGRQRSIAAPRRLSRRPSCGLVQCPLLGRKPEGSGGATLPDEGAGAPQSFDFLA